MDLRGMKEGGNENGEYSPGRKLPSSSWSPSSIDSYYQKKKREEEGEPPPHRKN